MKRCFYFVARFIRQGLQNVTAGVQETNEGYFDFVKAAKAVSEEEHVDIKKVVVTFWVETNSVMMGKFNSLKETGNGRV